MEEPSTCPMCDAPRSNGLECPSCGVIYARAERRVRERAASSVVVQNVGGAVEGGKSSWKERYRKQYLAGAMSDSELYVVALECISTQKQG